MINFIFGTHLPVCIGFETVLLHNFPVRHAGPAGVPLPSCLLLRNKHKALSSPDGPSRGQ